MAPELLPHFFVSPDRSTGSHEAVRPILGIAAARTPKPVRGRAQNPVIVAPLYFLRVIAVSAIRASKWMHHARPLKLIQIFNLLRGPRRLGFFHLPILLLAACSRNDPPPIDNAYCRLYVRLPDPSDAVHMKKRENKLAILANEQTWLHECGHAGTLKKGPI